MKEFVIETKTPGFSGTVTLMVPTIAERFEIIQKMGIKISENGVNLEELKTDLGALAKIIKTVMELIVSIDLKYGDIELKDKNALSYYMDAMPLYFEILQFAVQGLTLGKN